MVDFTLTKKRETDDGYIIREGLIFESGDYPDKDFQLSPEELIAASSDFKPATVNLEHIKTIFDGKLGKLDKIWASEDGYALYGQTKLPKWFDDVFGDEPIKVSCEWDRKDKTIAGLALTTRPRIKDAILMSAFNQELIKEGVEPKDALNQSLVAFGLDTNNIMNNKMSDNTWSGLDTIQSIHDMCARAGAICEMPAEQEDAEFVSQKESEQIQKMHDMAVAGGAKCERSFVPANYSEKNEMTLIEKLKAKFNEWAADVEKEEVTASTPIVDTSVKDLEAKFAQLEDKFNAEKAAFEAKLAEFTEAAKQEKETLEAQNKELADKLAAKDTEIEKFSADKTEADTQAAAELAKAKVEALVKDGKVLPAKSAQLEAIFSVLIENDSKVVFNDKDENAVDALFNLFDGIVSLKEEIPTEGTALSNDKVDASAAEIEKAKADARAWAKKTYKQNK